MPTVYFLCGMPASGKTTIAKKIEMENGAIRFTLDERMIAKYDLSIFDDQYGYFAAKEKLSIWEEAKNILSNGGDVILDWSLWSQDSRIEWTGKVIVEGYDYNLIYLEVPIDILRQRLSSRNSAASAIAHTIPLEELERFSGIFEPPSSAENLRLEIISVDR